MRSARTLRPILLVTLLGACGSEPTDPPPTGAAASVVLTPATATLLELDSVAISATVLDSNGRAIEGRTIVWESSDWQIANPQAPSAGWVQAGHAGTATIRASVSPENVFGTAEVTVLERPIASVVVTPSEDTIVVGGSTQLNAIPLDEEGQQLRWREVSWSVSDPSVLSLITREASRYAQGVGSGTATIEASAGGKTGTAKVTVLVVEYNGLAVGRLEACGRSVAGRWYCWGDQPRGLKTTLTFDTLAIAVGDAGYQVVPKLTCGLIQDGTAYCWGHDDAGEVGDGPGAQGTCGYTVRLWTPISPYHLAIPCAGITPVAGSLKFRSLASGGYTACGVTTAGAAYCWGANQYGQLGNVESGERCTVLLNEISSTLKTSPALLHQRLWKVATPLLRSRPA